LSGRLLPTPPVPAFGELLGTARLRERPEDFRVIEIPRVLPDGDGEHWLVRIRKRGLTTAQAGHRLAEAFGVRPRDVSHAGLKDRHAVTEQWLSIHAPRIATLPMLDTDELTLLEGARHRRKLRPGTLAGNRFELTLRALNAEPAALGRRLLCIAREGIPNFFGPQRFGHEGRNLDKALAWFEGRMRVGRRDLRGLLLSAARSELFNRVLAERVRAGTWNQPVDGDLFMLDGRQSVFAGGSEAPERLRARAAALEIHPAGPLAGRGGVAPEGEAAELEAAYLHDREPLLAGLVAHRVDAGRRPLRVPVRELWFNFPEPEVLRVGFTLPPGAYATSVLEQCLGITA
jgi:tRNA pseudouridine13 synthase